MGDVSDSKVFYVGVYTVLGLVSLGMTLMNMLTNVEELLTVVTAVFAACCALNIVLEFVGPNAAKVAKVLFGIEVIMMFTFFLISGIPEGFSAIWICLLPSLGMIFFNRTRGTVMCAIMFCILIFFLWTPVGRDMLLYDYTDTFRMRFPVLFVAFHATAFLLETFRVNSFNEMRRMQDYYHDLSAKDQLTKLFNRQGMYSVLEKDSHYRNAKKLGVAIFDIDDFKKVNDRYGHNMGDRVLQKIASLLSENLGTLICRWGGEEFVVVFVDEEILPAGFEKIRNLAAVQKFYLDEEKKDFFCITVSGGVCVTEDFNIDRIDLLIGRADKALYEAKESGKNNIRYAGQKGD